MGFIVKKKEALGWIRTSDLYHTKTGLFLAELPGHSVISEIIPINLYAKLEGNVGKHSCNKKVGRKQAQISFSIL